LTPLDLTSLSGRLLPYRGAADDPARPQEGFLASVALLLRPGVGGAQELLLIRRADFPDDPWSGHMAFPGGRWDPRDRHLLDTALREVWEETGIGPALLGSPVGRLEAVSPLSRALPPLSILPFLFRVPAGTEARCASHEVAEVHWIGLAEFLDPLARGTLTMAMGGSHLSFPSLTVRDRRVWGLTQRILADLLSRIG